MLHLGTEHFLDISAWRSDGEIVPELVFESGIVSKIFFCCFRQFRDDTKCVQGDE